MSTPNEANVTAVSAGPRATSKPKKMSARTIPSIVSVNRVRTIPEMAVASVFVFRSSSAVFRWRWKVYEERRYARNSRFETETCRFDEYRALA